MAKKTIPTPVDETTVDETKGTETAAVQAQPAEAEAEPAQAEGVAPATETAAPAETEAPATESAKADDAPETIETLDSLALRYRVPSWKQAAMLQMQGWAPGKHVSAADYEAALADLGTRPLGGGARR